MIKKLRDKAKGKKGFTLVELIVVIVIILILAAVMVPQLLRYVDQAREANATAEAATLLSELQAEFALEKANGEASPNEITVSGIVFTRTANDAEVAAAEDVKAFACTTDANRNNEEWISSFGYDNGTYTAVWTQAGEWEVTRNNY